MADLIGVYRITLLPDVDPGAFENFVQLGLFEEILSRGVRSTRHTLLKGYGESGANEYLWVVTLGHFGGSVVPSAIPGFLKEMAESAPAKLKPYGVLTAFTMFTEALGDAFA